MGNTTEQPVEFFEKFILNDVRLYIDKSITDFIQNTDYHNPTINYEKLEISYIDVDENNKSVERIYSIHIRLEHLLKREVIKSKNLLNQYSVEKDESEFSRIILNIKNSLRYIIRKGEDKIVTYPMLLVPIESMVDYINEKFLYNSDSKIILDLYNIKTRIGNSRLGDDADLKLVNDVIGYMAGDNDKREKIMISNDYDLMLSYLMKYINTGEYRINQKVRHVKISKSQLRYSFWVLHKKLYTTDSIQEGFVKLIWSMFEDFESWEFETLKRKFGSKDKVTFRKVNFLPEIIKRELQE